MPKTIKVCAEKLKVLFEKECKKMQKDEKHKVDLAAIEKVIMNSAPLKRGAKNPSGSPKKKRPLSSYMLFGQKVRPQIKKDHPDWDVVKTMKYIGSEWNKLSDAEKAKYK
jgi:hypothetical protein